MSWRTFTSRILPISALMLVVMFKFQNCAPTSNVNAKSASNGVVGIVDNFQQTPIQFISNPQLIDLQAKGPLEVQGLCVGGPDNQVIAYQVYDLQGAPQVVTSGQANCVMGGFQLTIASLPFNSCSDRYEIHATRIGQEDAAPSITTLQLDCTSPTVSN